MPEDIKDEPETLLGLVKTYSPSGKEDQAVDYLVSRMNTLRFKSAFRDDVGNAVGIIGDGQSQIVLLGHIDTVPGEIPVRILQETLEDGQKINNLFGRGTVDAKGPLAAFVDAAAACGDLPGWQIVVIGAVGEESDSSGARFITPRYHPKYAIIGEPSHWDRITIGYKGSAWVQVQVTCLLSHTASGAESACEASCKAWQIISEKVSRFNRERKKQFDRIQVSLREMESGGDGFEEWAVLRIGVRLPRDISPEDWYERLMIDQNLSTIAGLQILPTGYPIPAWQGDKNTPLVRAFLAEIRRRSGTPGFLLKTGTADSNIVASVWNCPVLAYGPGDSSLDHTPEEHIDLDEYHRSVKILTGVLRRLQTPSAAE